MFIKCNKSEYYRQFHTREKCSRTTEINFTNVKEKKVSEMRIQYNSIDVQLRSNPS